MVMKNRIVADKTIPSVIGMGLKDAIYLLENRGCRVRVEGYGSATPESGSRHQGQRTNLRIRFSIME